ncbi:class I glutamine amidotransferase-like protein [Calocera viscosa TUFC12733]|uniref:Class I glutamine amidotransferase-like protein n=1 Tax=Calocera viscosa (strain TUFC12733) TaxID=1330018 RepID=A0A167LGS3_CALVF|nr:class I glutamine amidotransferase-like protein [Calocera viscosa TUFC12733]
MPGHILFLLSSKGHDPTELAIPHRQLTRAGFTISFATSDGQPAQADPILLGTGSFARVWGAGEEAREAYDELLGVGAFKEPESWEKEGFDILKYDAILLPGGDDQSIRPFLESSTLHAQLAKFWPYCSRSYPPSPPTSTSVPAPGRKVLAAICHGPLPLSFTHLPSGAPLLKGVHSTTLPKHFELTAWLGSQLWGMGGYYRTYGAEGRWCAGDVVAAGARYVPGPWGPSPFVCVDPECRYVSARFPGDSWLFADKVGEEVRRALGG